jgi:predicted nucleic acid-binding protein
VTLFVDTSGLYAVLDSASDTHARARLAWAEILERGEPLVTTSYVVVECLALAQRRLGFEAARLIPDALVPVMDIVFVTSEMHARAQEAWLAARRRDLSLVDLVSFAYMREQRLERVFGSDAHFSQQGFHLAF